MQSTTPQAVECPICGKMGYTDERKSYQNTYPCATHYLMLTHLDEKPVNS